MVGEAVASVLAQTYRDFELMVVDDGSTDGTAGKLAKFGDRVHYLATENRGAAAARNFGVRQCRGRYVAFLDSDDLWRPGKLEAQVAYMERHPEVAVCQTEEIWIRNGVRVNPKRVHRKPSGEIFLRSLELCLVSPSAVMLKKESFEEAGGFDESFPVCEDYDLWLRLAVKYEVPLMAEPLVIKRGGHADQLSRSTWGLDRYRILALRKLLRSGIGGERRQAALAVLRRKAEILARGSRKRGKEAEAAAYESAVAEFERENLDVGSSDSQLRRGERLSPANP
jgi:GT2 family glycosyltransferase